MPTKPGFYAVRVGRAPGVYTTWDDCLVQVNGFSDARFKKFDRLEDAIQFINLPQHPSVVTPLADAQLDTIMNYPANVRSGKFNVPTDGVKQLDHDKQEITKKRRRGQEESHEPDVNDAESPVKRETTTERPTKKSQRRKTRHLSAYPASNNTALSDFLSLAKYKNPAVLSKLEQIGFGPHELLTMKGLREGAIARRFRLLIGGTLNSAAQVESLVFAVANANADAWNALEKPLLDSDPVSLKPRKRNT